MPHLDPERLSLLALYDGRLDAEGREHVGMCGECAADYAALRRAVDAVKTTPDAQSLEIPGPQVWACIHRQLRLSQALQADPLATVRKQAPVPPPVPALEPTRQPEHSQPLEPTRQPERTHPPEPTQLRERMRAAGYPRRPAAWWQRPGSWLAAAAPTLLVAGATVWTLNPAPAPVAQAELTPVAQHSATGSAKVVRAADGTRLLVVKLSKDEARGYQEVWLIAPDLSRLISLGIMNSDVGTFAVPAGVELADFPIVDVSDEPVDGNPGHSSNSIVRGTLNS
ncbi:MULTISPECIES: anti-sigma factor [unclassified Arthrobacter]|uniref:anti-sigma factor domain-containing protein n=1 Tax=unclassified Arthrobacter TaxID=235627 RepID=UPI003399A4C2